MKYFAGIMFLVCFFISFWIYADRNDWGMTALVVMIALGIVGLGITIEESKN